MLSNDNNINEPTSGDDNYEFDNFNTEYGLIFSTRVHCKSFRKD
jgi:hypothetical protein